MERRGSENSKNNELGRLVALMGAMRANKQRQGLRAVIFQDAVQKLGGHRSYLVRTDPFDESFQFTHEGGAAGFGQKYYPARKLLIVTEPGHEPFHDTGRDLFPTSPPVLAMLSPLDLPIWGGARDGYRVTSVAPEDEGHIRLNFGPKDDPDDLPGSGYVIIDLDSYVATELYYQGSRFSVQSLDTEIPSDTDLPSDADTY